MLGMVNRWRDLNPGRVPFQSRPLSETLEGKIDSYLTLALDKIKETTFERANQLLVLVTANRGVKMCSTFSFLSIFGQLLCLQF